MKCHAKSFHSRLDRPCIDKRELAAHWERIHQHEDKKKRAKMISRYHQVRFFERQKADRLVKKLRKQLIEATNSNEISTLKNELHVAEVDADYARHFPLLERYVSLYPQTISGKEQRPGEAGDGQDGSGKDPEDRFDAQGMAEVALHAPRPPLWATIEKIREEGRGALEKLRDRRTDIKPKRSQSERKSKEILARKSDVTQVKRTKQTYANIDGMPTLKRHDMVVLQGGIVMVTVSLKRLDIAENLICARLVGHGYGYVIYTE
ncbi:hypothetical protein P8C59_003115 [Phyllachora maydis]|uniref:rRNA-processing protein EFG1 n=1 Tax=Phyllachora maydis TaxID=1825666 RepID=A0AAD9HZS0_9PEZI|nr:hypothetical protein P8C59_003115 [Phyllachora maydis]